MRALITFLLAIVLCLGASAAPLAGDYDDGMGFDDGFSSPNEDLKNKTNISYVKQKAMAQANKAMKEAEEAEEAEDAELQEQIDEAVADAVADQSSGGTTQFTLDDVQ